MFSVSRLPDWAKPKEIFDLVRLAVPVALSRSSFMLMGLTDAIILGRHRTDELPLVLVGWLPNGVFMGFGMGLMLGVSVLTAELNGSGKGSETGRIFRRGMLVALAYSIIATLACVVVAAPLLRLLGFEPDFVNSTAQTTRILAYGTLGHMIGIGATFYLEALRRPNIVTVISMVAVAFNLVVDLILVPTYGAVGVVWATTASRTLIAVLSVIAALALTPALKRSPAGPQGEFLRQNKVGLGTGVANVAEWGSFNMTFVIASLVSYAAGTAYGLTVQFLGVIFMVYLGLGTATSVRVAESYGRKDAVGVRNASRLGVVTAFIAGGALALLLLLLRDPIAAFALNSSEDADANAHLLPMLAGLMAVAAFISLFDGQQAVGSMALRAQNVVWWPTAIHVGSYVLLMVPIAWYLALVAGIGVWGVMVGVAVASVLAGCAQVIVLEWKAARGVRTGISSQSSLHAVPPTEVAAASTSAGP
ncbi:MAG: MATE family efflux transporter [Hyphomonadaceae bacterium]